MSDKVFLDNFRLLTSRDTVKLVISDRTDFDFAVSRLNRKDYDIGVFARSRGITIAFSPVIGILDPKELLGWLQAEYWGKLCPVLSVQLHKLIKTK